LRPGLVALRSLSVDFQVVEESSPTAWDINEGLTSAMSKCHVRELSRVYKAIFQDVLYAYPTMGTELEKDLTRLLAIVERRGIRVYLEDLPAVGKHLDRCLASGQYNLSGLPLTKRYSNRVVIPKFLRGLYLLVFYECGRLREDYDVQAIFFLRQILFAAKKATYPCSDEKVENEVLEFFEVDKSLPEPEGIWTQEGAVSDDQIAETYSGYSRSRLYGARLDPENTCERNLLSTLLARLDAVSSFVSATLGSYDPAAWRFRHGPGAISEVTGPSNKYCWKDWPDRLESEYPIADYGFHSFSSWAGSSFTIRPDTGPARGPTHSRMVAVPKSYSKPRLIAAEPSAHQWCQQSVWRYFKRRSKNTWINEFVRFGDQTLNQDLCIRGSSDGSLATVDLSAASDRVSCHFVGQLFRGNPGLLRSLRASRTHWVKQSLTKKVTELSELRKFSTMGNACTFPVESLGFLCVAIASVLTVRKLPFTPRNVYRMAGEVAVFGDDIVIPNDSRELFVKALEVLHFKVNKTKSFWTGRFRESCGVDSFGGAVVTPAYWKSFYNGKPESLASTVESSNNFYKKFLVETSRHLASTLPKGLPVVAQRSGILGLQSRSEVRNDRLRRRYNPALQREELFVLSLVTTQRKVQTGDDSMLFQYFTEQPSPFAKWTAGVAQIPRLRTKFGWVSSYDVQLKDTEAGRVV
jgi:hypothetical protein